MIRSVVRSIISIVLGLILYFIIIFSIASRHMHTKQFIIASLVSGVFAGYISRKYGWISGFAIGLTIVLFMIAFWIFLLGPASGGHPDFFGDKNNLYRIFINIFTCTLGGIIGELIYRTKIKLKKVE
jgi:hypothetical protein